MVVRGSPLCADYSTGGALFLLFLIVLVNSGMRRIAERLGLGGRQLALVYTMLVVASAIPSWGFVMNLLAVMAGPVYYANPANRWETVLLPNLPQHLIISNADAARAFYEGLGPGQSLPWSAWMAPLGWWLLLAAAMYAVQVGLAVILHEQWSRNERLVYPLTQLPIELTCGQRGQPAPAAFLRNRLLWVGFAVPFLLHSMKALHGYYPTIPAPQLGWWPSVFRGHTYLAVNVFFEVIGLSYLLTTDVALGLWLFPLLNTVLVGLLGVYGLNTEPPEYGSDPGTPPIAYAGFGAMTVLVAQILWRSRPHVQAALDALRPGSGVPTSTASAAPRGALLAVAAGIVVMVVWLAYSGMNPTTAVVFVVVAIVTLTGLARVVSQGGIPYGRPSVAVPTATLYGLGGEFVGRKGIGALAVSASWAVDIRTAVMASAANGLKIADVADLRRGDTVLAWAVGMLVTWLGTAWFATRMAYTHGAVSLGGWQMVGLAPTLYRWMSSEMETLPPVKPARFGYMGLGAVLYWAIAHGHDAYSWFPVHPLGMTLGLAGPVAWVWFSVFLAWLLKVAVMRYGGPKTYRGGRPLFLGMVLGSFTAAGVWIVLDALFGGRGHTFTLT